MCITCTQFTSVAYLISVICCIIHCHIATTVYEMKIRIRGGPAAKFIYYIIKTKYPIEQSELINITLLSRRTVQSAIDELVEQGLIMNETSSIDARKKVYCPA